MRERRPLPWRPVSPTPTDRAVRRRVAGPARRARRPLARRAGVLPRASPPRPIAWIEALAANAREQHPGAPRFALLAVGGYGRGELAPQSDLDLLLVHDSKAARVEDARVGDLVPGVGRRTRSSGTPCAPSTSRSSSPSTTSTPPPHCSPARHIAGDTKLQRRGHRARVRRAGRSASQAVARRCSQHRVRERQATAGEVAYILEPDVKDGHGGLRDVQSLWWAECGGLALSAEDDAALDECYDVLLDARVALHRATGRPGDVLRLEDQDAAAARPARRDADALMAASPAPPARVAWIADEAWGRVEPRDRWRSRDRGRAGCRCCSTARSSSPTTPIRRSIRRYVLARRHRRRPPRRPHRAPHARSARERGAAVARALAGRRSRQARRAAARGPRRDPRDGGARPARAAHADAPGVGAGSIDARSATPTTASRSTVTCGRRPPTPPSSSTSRRPTRPARARRAVPRHRQGLPGRSHRGRHRARPRARSPASASAPPTPTC